MPLLLPLRGIDIDIRLKNVLIPECLFRLWFVLDGGAGANAEADAEEDNADADTGRRGEVVEAVEDTNVDDESGG